MVPLGIVIITIKDFAFQPLIISIILILIIIIDIYCFSNLATFEKIDYYKQGFFKIMFCDPWSSGFLDVPKMKLIVVVTS